MLVTERKRRKNHQKDQTQVSNNFKLLPHREYQFIQRIPYYAEKAKQAPAASSADLELLAPTNEHQYQSSQGAQGNATIGRPYYYQVCRNELFFLLFFILAFNRSCLYLHFIFSSLIQLPLSNQIRCTCIRMCTQCPCAHHRYSN
jgi:hypothetical protein